MCLDFAGHCVLVGDIIAAIYNSNEKWRVVGVDGWRVDVVKYPRGRKWLRFDSSQFLRVGHLASR